MPQSTLLLLVVVLLFMETCHCFPELRGRLVLAVPHTILHIDYKERFPFVGWSGLAHQLNQVVRDCPLRCEVESSSWAKRKRLITLAVTSLGDKEAETVEYVRKKLTEDVEELLQDFPSRHKAVLIHPPRDSLEMKYRTQLHPNWKDKMPPKRRRQLAFRKKRSLQFRAVHYIETYIAKNMNNDSSSGSAMRGLYIRHFRGDNRIVVIGNREWGDSLLQFASQNKWLHVQPLRAWYPRESRRRHREGQLRYLVTLVGDCAKSTIPSTITDYLEEDSLDCMMFRETFRVGELALKATGFWNSQGLKTGGGWDPWNGYKSGRVSNPQNRVHVVTFLQRPTRIGPTIQQLHNKVATAMETSATKEGWFTVRQM